MRKQIMLLMTLCIVGFSSAQIYDDPAGGTDQYLNLTPNSPQATELVRYGNIPVNLSTGQLNYTIPIYTIEANGVQWPISLSYDYSGLKAEARPSTTGLGWQMISGGVVTREVRGLPDEQTVGGKGYYSETAKLVRDRFVNDNEMGFGTVKSVLDGLIDTEPDKYNVNAGGLSFSFKVASPSTGVYEAVLLSDENYKVDFSFDEIKVTDDNGVQYIFNQKEIHTPRDLPSEIYIEGLSDSWTVSWFLSKIIAKDYTTNGLDQYNTITFEYINHTYESKSFFASGFVNDREIQVGNSLVVPDQSYNDGFSRTNIVQPALSRIVFPQGSVNFSLANTNDYPHYTGVNVINKDLEEIYDYDFAFATNVSRRVLSQITRNGEFYYGFEYYNLDKLIPYSDSQTQVITAQDEWGYYNGQVQNQYVIDNPQSAFRANKLPYFDYTVAGALKKITYPYKGTTEIFYEQNQVKADFNAITSDTPNMQHQYRLQLGNRFVSSADRTKTQTFTLNYPAYAEIDISEETFAINDKVAASIRRLDNNSCIPGGQFCPGDTNLITGEIQQQADVAREICGDPYPLICPRYNQNFDINIGGDSGDIGPGGIILYSKRERSGIVKIPAGTYELRVRASGTTEVSIDFAYREVKTGSINVNMGGLRVAKTLDYDPLNPQLTTEETLYDYNDDFGLSMGLKFHREIKNIIKSAQYFYNPGSDDNTSISCVFVDYTTKQINYHTYNPVNVNSGLPVFYPKVKVIKNPQVIYKPLPDVITSCGGQANSTTNEDGSLEYELLFAEANQRREVKAINGYSIEEFKRPYVFEERLEYPFVPVGDEKTGAVPLKMTTYGIEEFTENEYTSSETVNTYQQFKRLNSAEINEIPVGIKVADRIQTSGTCFIVPNTDELLNLYYYRQIYRDRDIHFYNDTSTSKSYSMKGELIASIATTNTYNDKHYMASSEFTDSEGKLVKNSYVYPFSDNASAGSGALTSLNKLTTQVGMNTTKDGVIYGAQEIRYTNNLTGHPSVEAIRIAKEDRNNNGDLVEEMEDRVSYFKYDVLANPTELTKTDGAPIVYLWGYDYNHPILKIENATYDQVIQALATDDPDSGSLGITYEGLQLVGADGIDAIHTKLSKLLPNSMVYGYAYKRLVGVVYQIDPRGYKTSYTYDHQQRLEHVIDKDGHVMQTNEYNWRD